MSEVYAGTIPSPVSFGAVDVSQFTTAAALTTDGFNTADGYGIAKLAADPYAASQWYLQPNNEEAGSQQVGINITAVWADYSGDGVSIGVIDEGFDYTHQDITPNYDINRDIDRKDALSAQDARPDYAYHTHGTWVSGVLAADDNGFGVVGVAYDADIIGHYIRFGFGGSSLAETAGLVAAQADVDVSNNSWGYSTPFSDNFDINYWAPLEAAVETAIREGRDGKGTILVHAAGNDRQYVAGDGSQDGDNVNYHSLLNSRYTIAVAATDAEGNVASFSTPGAALLVSAPGVSMLTTHNTDNDGDPNDDFVYVSGTSFAAPVISGVVANMLEANAELSWRDVQEILVNAAIKTGEDAGWQTNGAGFDVSHDFGFGLIDAKAAVRLAESWNAENALGAEISHSESFAITNANNVIADLGSQSYTVTIDEAAPDMRVEWVEVSISIEHDTPGNLRIILTGPSGITSILADRPMGGQYAINDLNFTFSSGFYRGEGIAGDWTVSVFDDAIGDEGIVTSASLRFYGAATDDADQYVIADSMTGAAGAQDVINDDGGQDHLNLAAYSQDLIIHLRPGADIALGERLIKLGETTWIENATTGDGADRIVANGRDNILNGARGDDQLIGGGGNDRLEGGDGSDILSGGGGNDILIGGAGGDQILMGAGHDSVSAGDGADTIRVRADQLTNKDSIDGGDGANDTLILQSSGFLDFTSIQSFTGIERVRLAAGQEVIANDDGIYWVGRSGQEQLTLGAGNDIVKAGGGADRITGGGGNDILIAQGGDDVISGGAGDDKLVGGGGADIFEIGPNDDIDIIYDFTAGVDQILFDGLGLSDFDTDLLPLLREVGSKTLIELPNDGLVLLNGVSIDDLSAADFILS